MTHIYENIDLKYCFSHLDPNSIKSKRNSFASPYKPLINQNDTQIFMEESKTLDMQSDVQEILSMTSHGESANLSKESYVQELIQRAEDGVIIHLPPAKIRFNNLVISKSLTIQGVPGTILEIVGSPLTIDHDTKISNTTAKVIICECTIQLEVQKQVDSRANDTEKNKIIITEESKVHDKRTILNLNTHERTDTIPNQTEEQFNTLIEIYGGSCVEIRDCTLKSFFRDLKTKEDKSKYIDFQDTAISLKQSQNYLNHASLIVKSSTFACFYTPLSGEGSCSINLQKCTFLESRGHPITIMDPENVNICECYFDRPQKSAINIRFSKNTKQINPAIVIQKNEIIAGNSYGISIFGLASKTQSCLLYVNGNKIRVMKKDGIAIKFIQFTEAIIHHNLLDGNQGNAMSLQNVWDPDYHSPLVIQSNLIRQCDGNGIILANCTASISENQILQNAKNGILMIEDLEQKVITSIEDLKIVINNCKIEENKEAGIHIKGQIHGPFIISLSSARRNNYGILIHEKEVAADNKSISKQNANTTLPNSVIYFSLEKCEISNNNTSGIHIDAINHPLYFSDSTITLNKDNAIYLSQQSFQEFLIFKDLNRENPTELINGNIGGPWGTSKQPTVTDKKSSDHKCTVF